MRLPPYTPAASRCAVSGPGTSPKYRPTAFSALIPSFRADPSVFRFHRSGRPVRVPGSSGPERQLDEAALLGGVIDSLRRLAVIARFGRKDTRDKRLRVPVVKREPARLDLHHDSVPRPKNMIGRRQGETVLERRVWRNRLGLGEALAVPAAENVGGDHELIAPHHRVAADLVRIDVDQLDDPIRVGAARR